LQTGRRGFLENRTENALVGPYPDVRKPPRPPRFLAQQGGVVVKVLCAAAKGREDDLSGRDRHRLSLCRTKQISKIGFSRIRRKLAPWLRAARAAVTPSDRYARPRVARHLAPTISALSRDCNTRRRCAKDLVRPLFWPWMPGGIGYWHI
jgi:hypothetical protein